MVCAKEGGGGDWVIIEKFHKEPGLHSVVCVGPAHQYHAHQGHDDGDDDDDAQLGDA